MKPFNYFPLVSWPKTLVILNVYDYSFIYPFFVSSAVCFKSFMHRAEAALSMCLMSYCNMLLSVTWCLTWLCVVLFYPMSGSDKIACINIQPNSTLPTWNVTPVVQVFRVGVPDRFYTSIVMYMTGFEAWCPACWVFCVMFEFWSVWTSGLT